MEPCSEHLCQTHGDGSRRSAKEIVPLVIEDVWGVDDDYVPRGRSEIPAERFLPHDLRQPFRLDRQFDAVVSLEVAEHLPSGCAETFMDSLTRRDCLETYPLLEREHDKTSASQLFAVHPRKYLAVIDGTRRHLRSQARCVLENDCLVVFDLRVQPS